MELTPEALGAGAVGIIVIFGAIGQYLRTLKTKPVQDPMIASIGMEFGNREQMERLIGEVAGCRKALDALADKRAAEIEDIHKTLLERLDREEARRPPRR